MLLPLVFSSLALTAVASPLERRQSSVPVGATIYKCTAPNTIALTFDDGPGTFGTSILDQLAAYGAKATFFMNGNNYAPLDSQTAYIQRAVSEGHQIGSHTESHPHLPLLDQTAVAAQMTDAEARFYAVIGKIPTYMRPPFLETTPEVLATLGSLGYHVIDIDFDTLDWAGDYTAAKANWDAGFAAGGTLVLMHEVYADTVNVLLPYVLEAVKASGKKAVTVGECLGDAPANWYRGPRGATTTTTTTSATPTTTAATSATTTSAAVTTTSSAGATTTSASAGTSSTGTATTSSGAATTTSAGGASSTYTSGAASSTTSAGGSYPTKTPPKSCKAKKRRNVAQ